MKRAGEKYQFPIFLVHADAAGIVAVSITLASCEIATLLANTQPCTTRDAII